LAKEVSVNGAETELIAESVFTKLPGHRLVFVNGFFSAKLSSIKPVSGGVRIENLASALAKDSALIEKYLGKYAHTASNTFAALNQAFFTDGAFIFVPKGVEVAEPVQLIYISSAKNSGETILPRNLVIAEANSKLTVVESYISTGNVAYFTNAVTEILAGDNAKVEHVKLQDEAASAYHIATIAGEFGRASNVTVHSFALGAKLSRTNIRTKLVGEGLECILNGLYLTKDEQLADHHMIVEHAQPHCASHEYFNGILDDKSKGVFHGRILVQQIAQKTDAKQTNKNLLLSDDATADTKPQLEIYADDVKCTHGATIGQLNDESIFYLRSRGIGRENARRMLIHAFAGEIIERIKCVPAREVLDKLVWDRLEANHHLVEKN
jgi:Fe-S cluster assembly protein SufD